MSQEPEPVVAPALGRPVALVLGTLVAIAWLYRLVTPLPPPLTFEAPSASAAPSRPPVARRIDLGTAAARSFLVSGFGPDEQLDGRSVVRTLGAARLALELVPDVHGLALGLVLRSAGAPTRVALKLNGKLVGSENAGAEWSVASFTLPESSLYSGKNTLELDSGGGPLIVDSLDVQAVAARSELDLGAPAARGALAQGWVLEEIGGRLVAHVDRAPAAVALELRPRPGAYLLGLVAQTDGTSGVSTVEVAVNGARVGNVAVRPGGSSEIVVVPNERLRAGSNRIELTRSIGPSVAVGRLSLEPLVDAVALDVGTPSARPHLAAGFSVDERAGCGSCAWSSGPRSRVDLYLAPNVGPYELVVRAHAFGPAAPVVATLTLNGEPLGSARFGETFESARIAVPPGRLKEGENRLELTYDRTATPRATLPGSKDERELALRYDLIELFPAPAP